MDLRPIQKVRDCGLTRACLAGTLRPRRMISNAHVIGNHKSKFVPPSAEGETLRSCFPSPDIPVFGLSCFDHQRHLSTTFWGKVDDFLWRKKVVHIRQKFLPKVVTQGAWTKNPCKSWRNWSFPHFPAPYYNDYDQYPCSPSMAGREPGFPFFLSLEVIP